MTPVETNLYAEVTNSEEFKACVENTLTDFLVKLERTYEKVKRVPRLPPLSSNSYPVPGGLTKVHSRPLKGWTYSYTLCFIVVTYLLLCVGKA